MIIRKATIQDLPAVAGIYEAIHREEAAGHMTIGWERGVYPTRETAEAALQRDDLFVEEGPEGIVGTAIINRNQEEAYRDGHWRHEAAPEQVMVLHTLAISPAAAGKGYGKEFVAYYEEYAGAHGCPHLRMDTNERNANARGMYRKLGYEEVGIVPCVFHSIGGVRLVLLEKYLGE